MPGSRESSIPTTSVGGPWILAQRHDGSSDALTLAEVFHHAADLRRLAVEPEIRAFALVRVLVAMLRRVSPEPIDRHTWELCWRERRLPVDVSEHLDACYELRQSDLAGTASAGHFDGILIEGENVLQTLLLNLIPHDAGLQTDAPSSHRPERRLWRGVTAMLGDTAVPPVTLQWLAQISDDILAPNYVAHLRAITAGRTPRTSIVAHQLSVPARVLRPEQDDLRAVTLRAIDDVDLAVLAYAQLRDNLDRAAGGNGGAPVRDAARAAAFAHLDPHFRRWIVRFSQPNVAAQDAGPDWSTTARHLLFGLAQHALAAGGLTAWAGRDVAGLRPESGLAEAWFIRTLFMIFPDS